MNKFKLKLRSLYAATAATIQSHLRLGDSIFSEDWDALVILDACRVDALREVQDEYEFLGLIESRWSRGSTSKEWLENTFIQSNKETISSTAYVTSNYYAGHLENQSSSPIEYPMARHTTVLDRFFSQVVRDDGVSAEQFKLFVNLFETLIGEDELQLHPNEVTKAAIKIARDNKFERIIIHYMQPHHAYIHADETAPWNEEPFSYLTDGGDLDKVWESYVDNLRLVLDHVDILLDNLDAEQTVITADHGELFGEWGLYGHAVGVPHPDLRKVPYAMTTARDTESCTPEIELPEKSVSNKIVEKRLNALGYR